MANGFQPAGLTMSIVKTLLYFDIFHYPLTSAEVFQFLQTNHVSEAEVNAGLESLVKESVVFRLGNFFSPQNNNDLEVRRNNGNKLAQENIVLAHKKARLISRFPFVRAVMISGSLSKGYMDEKSDFDFFIVTEKERLWIARTLLVLYKRIFLFNSHKYFCINYFVDYAHLEIEEKNLFTATELATLIPVIDQGYYSALMNTNKWLTSFFPNYLPRVPGYTTSGHLDKLKSYSESLINILFANYWENYFMHLTLSRWKKKYEKKYDKTDFKVAFKTKKYVSKNHPNNYQRRVMSLYEEKLRSFEKLNSNTRIYE